jgi:nitrile hydratase
VRGCKGRIERIAGEYRNPEELAFGRFDAPIVPLYRVRFQQNEVWSEYHGNPRDTLDVEIFEFWLEPSNPEKT